jgi:hypothetical protein
MTKPLSEALAEAERKERESIAASNAEYVKQWPHVCKNCGGWGGFYTPARGISGPAEYYEPPGGDPCETYAPSSGARIANADDPRTCHRCGDYGMNEDGDGPCSTCGHRNDEGLIP